MAEAQLVSRLGPSATIYPVHRSAIPPGTLRAGRYDLRFARDPEDLARVQRLRFEVFNVELDEGLDSAWLTGRDEDDLDRACHHLMVIHRESGEIVGTYRLMQLPMALARGGFYSESEYDFSTMPEELLARGVELGRACVHEAHRNGRVIHLLWKGLARYLAYNDKRYLFGCCSMPTLDEAAGVRIHDDLRRGGHLHARVHVEPREALRISSDVAPSDAPFALPPLCQSYLGLGAKIVSGPAVDRDFKVIDFLIVLDLEAMDPRVRQSFFAKQEWSA